MKKVTFAVENHCYFFVIFLKISMKEIIVGLIFLITSSFSVFAQEMDATKPQILINLAQNDSESGRIEIIQPPQVENLLKMQIANNRLQEGIPGYRIQIFSDSRQTARQRAEDIRRDFMRTFPDIEAYLKHDTPNFKIFVGNFRTKDEALRERKKIEKIFPGAFIVSSTIEIEK